jgi:hypothetical protein
MDVSRLPKFTERILTAETVQDYITGTKTQDDLVRTGLESFTADGMTESRRIQLRMSLDKEEITIIEGSHNPELTLDTKFDVHSISIPETAHATFEKLLEDIYKERLQPLADDQTSQGNMVTFNTRAHDWKAKAVVTLVKTTRGTERMVAITTRQQRETDTITIPWLLFDKLVKAYARIKSCYKQNTNVKIN